MSNEIQLTPLNSSLAASNGAAGGLGAYYGQSAPAGDENPVRKLHRLLRGRYLLAIVLGLIGAAAGAAAGFLSQKPAYKSTGMIEINPRIVDYKNDSVMVMFTSYVQAQIARLSSDSLIRMAMNEPAWQKVRPGPVNAANAADFSDKLSVTLPPRSSTIIVATYTDVGPDAQAVCSAAMQSLMTVYQREYDNTDALKLDARIHDLNALGEYINRQVAAKRLSIQNLSKTTDGDPTQVRFYEQQLAETEKLLSTCRETIAATELTAKNATGRKLAPEDWGRADASMASKIRNRDELQAMVRTLTAQFGGARHPEVIKRQTELDSLLNDINEFAERLDSKYVIRWNLDGTGGQLVNKDLTALRESEKRLIAQIADQTTRVQNLREVAEKIRQEQFDISALIEQSRRNTDDLRAMQFRKDQTDLAKVVDTGVTAKPDKDRRPVFAAVGFLGGAGIPVGLLLLFGLFDTRYRYSDETAAAASTMPGGLTLLGILPNLPDRLSDPEQAAIAAHCVHQIRTMLQINTGLEERRVFSVTSASPGDGKTSLTLALGLSYAACGTRTLLIDCDLIGSGLSSRMNVAAPEGVLEAIANRSLMPYVRQTDVNDVSILPVGSAGALHASTLSPQSLRRLIEEAEQHFEVILIDTGPIMGSIEASLVCAAADAVILAVSRGQQRPMVERSISHLAAIGAKLAGVVFNRAQAQDFERSISGVSMRSVGVPGLPRGARPTGPRLGPVAHAVKGDTGSETPPAADDETHA